MIIDCSCFCFCSESVRQKKKGHYLRSLARLQAKQQQFRKKGSDLYRYSCQETLLVPVTLQKGSLLFLYVLHSPVTVSFCMSPNVWLIQILISQHVVLTHHAYLTHSKFFSCTLKNATNFKPRQEPSLNVCFSFAAAGCCVRDEKLCSLQRATCFISFPALSQNLCAWGLMYLVCWEVWGSLACTYDIYMLLWCSVEA